MGPLGWQETVFIFILALLLFGPKKLPELGRTLGKALTEFKRASNDLKATFDRELSAIERENESIKEVTSSYTSDYSYNYDYNNNYDSSYYDAGSNSSASQDSTATNSSTVGASAIQGAESNTGAQPEGTATTPAPADQANHDAASGNTGEPAASQPDHTGELKPNA